MLKPKLLTIVGPTASGKTALAVAVAKRLSPAEIISGDALTVYKGFDIGTAKPTAEEMGGIKHHLIDVLSPAQSWHVVDFKQAAEKIIARLNAQNILPILAGGTGLYVKALLEDYQFNEQTKDEEYRSVLMAQGEKFGKEHLLAKLREVDEENAARLANGDLRRIVRALEVARGGKEVLSQKRVYGDGENLAYDALTVGLDIRRETLYARINERTRRMFECGWLEEVQTLLAAGVAADANAMKGIGYRECAACLAGRLGKDELTEQVAKATRHFAKRQMTWYRKMPYIHWLDAEKGTAALTDEVCRLAQDFWQRAGE